MLVRQLAARVLCRPVEYSRSSVRRKSGLQRSRKLRGLVVLSVAFQFGGFQDLGVTFLA